MNKRAVRQHVVPIMLLSGFTDASDQKTLWRYDKVQHGVIRTTPADAAVVKHFYDVPGTDPEYIERRHEKIESNAGLALAKLRSRQGLTLTEFVDWALFVAYQSVRTPCDIESQLATGKTGFKLMLQWLASDPHKFEVVIRRLQEEEHVPKDADIEQARQDFLNWNVDFEPPRHEFLLGLIELALAFAKLIVLMRWTILIAPRDCHFVCSDNPVYVEDPERNPFRTSGAGLASSPTVELTCPMSSESAMLGTWQRGVRLQYRAVQPPVVREVNKRTVLGAERFVFGSRSDDRIARLVMKYSNAKPTAVMEKMVTEGDGLLTRLSHRTHPVKSIVEMMTR